MNATITIDMDKPCSRCGKKGAADGGLCLDCVLKRMESQGLNKPFYYSGWAEVENGRKWHYFKGGSSLCGKYKIRSRGILEKESGNTDCVTCTRRLKFMNQGKQDEK